MKSEGQVNTTPALTPLQQVWGSYFMHWISIIVKVPAVARQHAACYYTPFYRLLGLF